MKFTNQQYFEKFVHKGLSLAIYLRYHKGAPPYQNSGPYVKQFSPKSAKGGIINYGSRGSKKLGKIYHLFFVIPPIQGGWNFAIPPTTGSWIFVIPPILQKYNF